MLLYGEYRLYDFFQNETLRSIKDELLDAVHWWRSSFSGCELRRYPYFMILFKVLDSTRPEWCQGYSHE